MGKLKMYFGPSHPKRLKHSLLKPAKTKQQHLSGFKIVKTILYSYNFCGENTTIDILVF